MKEDVGGRASAATARELPAGRELDALVAEKVFGDCGWDIVIDGISRVGRYFETRDEAAAYRETIRDRWHVGPVVLHGDVPEYSTDIAAAWLVVEKMHSADDRVWDDFEASTLYDGPLTLIHCRGPEAAAAICRAALKAVAERSEAP